ncbi:MAG: MFS transporter [Verrucomicrobia bacterium]|nr:MAG: MFS transporter [Verrucomicrobiota bacterium]
MLMALCFISHFNRASMASAGDERIMKQFGISTQQMGMVYSAFLLVYTVFMIPGGFFIDRYGPRIALALMGVSTAAFCAFTGAVGFGFIVASQVWLSLILVRSLMGLFTTPLHPSCARSAANWFPEHQRTLANGLINSAALLAYAAVHPLFGALIDWVDWPNAFLIAAACTAFLASGWFIYATDHPWQHRFVRESTAQSAASEILEKSSTREKAGASGPRFGELVRSRSLILLTLSYGAVGYFQYLFFYWLHFYFDDILHLGKTESRYYDSLPKLAMAVGMPLGGWLTDLARKKSAPRFGRALVPKAGMIFSSVLLLLGIAAHETFWVILWFTLALGVLGLCEGAFWTTAVELGGSRGGTAAAVMNTGGNGIGLLAPMITPWISAKLGWTSGIGLGALIGLLGAWCWWGINPAKTVRESKH